MKRRWHAIAAAFILAAVLIATGSAVIHKPLPKPEPVMPPRIRLNDRLENGMSEIPALAGLDRKVKAFMGKWQLNGVSLAVMRNDSLLYAKGYGWADKENGTQMAPGHILRMASVSKLLTAAGIMVLQDRDSLCIKDKVFGPDGILDDPFYSSLIKDCNFNEITIEHLLRHQAGFWRDPLFSSLDVMAQLGLDCPHDEEDFCRVVLNRPLRFMPGTSQKYSNFGYLILSKVIEKVSGKPYAQFMQEDVLNPAGCFDMHIAGNYYQDKRPNEVRYYTHEGDGKYIEDYSGNGNIVERCYGGNNIPVLSGAGAWCGSPSELARFVASIDGHPGIPDIISPESVALMTEYFDTETFSLGWNDTNPSKGWSRTGTFSGTSALVRHYPDGECWILITNTSTWRGPGLSRYTEALFQSCREEHGAALPSRDMFCGYAD